MKKIKYREHKKLNKLLIDLDINQVKIFDKIFQKYIDIKEYTHSKMFRMSENLVLIIQNNKKNHEALFLEYYSNNNTKRKLEIKFGPKRVIEFVNKLKSREKPKVPHSIFDFNFWIKKGYTEETAKDKVSKIQKENNKKRSFESYKNHSKKIKFSLDYWLNCGYSLEEAKILRIPYLDTVKNDLKSLINKYGIEKGTEKWTKRCLKYKKSIKENLENRKSAGYVSKESLKFFIPLYKFCRRLGIERKHIYFGIGGSREFFIKDNNLPENGGKFYDFTISKLNVIIEYNGIFWHPRKIEEWHNPWVDYESAILNENYKKMLASSRNMDYHVIWSDDNLEEKLEEMCQIIKRKFYECRGYVFQQSSTIS
jgi:hypothetical protein